MLVFFLALSTTCFGQSVIDFAKRSDAMEYVGNMAHPMQKVLGAKVLSSGSNNVDISINFKSIGRTYWEDYRININTVRGVKYYSSIDRIRKVSIYAPFGGQRWVRGIMDGIMNYMGYSNSDSEGLRLLYGKSNYGDMSNEQLAAYNLMGLFLEYYK